MLNVLELKDRENFMNNYLNPAINEGFVIMLYPNGPKHPKQKYTLTDKGLNVYYSIVESNNK